MDQQNLQGSPKMPNMVKACQMPRVKTVQYEAGKNMKTREKIIKKQKVARQPPPRLARPCYLARAGRVSRPSPGCLVFLHDVSISRGFCAFCSGKSLIILSHGHPIPLILPFYIIFRVSLD